MRVSVWVSFHVEVEGGGNSYTIDSVIRGMGDHAVGGLEVDGMGNMGGRTLFENCREGIGALDAILGMPLR